MMHWYGWGGEYTMGHGMGWVAMIVFWILLLVAVFFLIKIMANKSGGKSSRGETAEEILKKRYARGELSREQYEEALKVIRR